MSEEEAMDALTARMLAAERSAEASAAAAQASEDAARKTAQGQMQGTALTGVEKKLLLQILQLAANKYSAMQPEVDELRTLWQEDTR